MNLLTLLNGIFQQGYAKTKDTAPTGEERVANPGEMFVFKKNEQGQDVRLARPMSNPFARGETLSQFSRPGFSSYLQPEQEVQAPKPQGFNILKSLGPITAFGSPYWKPGLDIGLNIGDPVPSPASGKVSFVGPRGGFGNQVRVAGDDGRTYWMSHLNKPGVQMGQRVGAGDIIGEGGNTGKVIAMRGGSGSHLDLTIEERGKYMAAEAVKDLLESFM